tara:strand:- start:2126 stop:2257 length:132 start_codon:yes stop_codon:yes gene_type:complete
MILKAQDFMRTVGTATASGIFPEAVEVASLGFSLKPHNISSQL